MNGLENKFEKNVFKNIDKNNFNMLIQFLIDQNCDYIEDIISDYLDIFIIEYKDFIKKFNKLNTKYNGLFLEKASQNMNLFEDFYNV